MIIEDNVRLKVMKVKKKDKVYDVYFVSLATKYTDVLSRLDKLQNVEIIAGDKRVMISEVKLYKHSYYYKKSTGEKIPLISFTVPKHIGEELWKKGVRKLKVIAEVPEQIIRA